ncbi:S1C family serine protease [Paenibacillus sp. MER TA 81-3]|uniref:S1C family serine protease n=1 Tax=Paenibacillus sp. MER TA 81-3 TaxID=2939573 RepID=UPI00203BBE91|nr:S1C family serine protease [Paenibacillus sp. MER TA 81-3]MCM3338808.1 S1C family serine protease [Paenibacillus sp. MER TA 81-3]
MGERRKNSIGRRTWRVGISIVLGLTLGVTSVSGQASNSVTMKATKVKDKVYIEADAFEQMTGSKGMYDAKTKTYRYAPNDIPAIVKKVSPSVVSIIGKHRDAEDNSDNWLAHGTGVVVRQDGWIVTNAHVISELVHPLVVTPNGKSYPVTKWFADEESDLAIAKIAVTGLQPVSFVQPDAALQVGESVVALGTPVSFTLRNSATTGIISGTDRAVESSYKLIQTDAAINPGNSGGPLVNMKGEVVGINSMKFAAVGIENMGFAIPADTVKMAVQHFFKFGKIMRASLGVEMEESWAAYVGLPSDDPIKVTTVQSTSAKKAGIAAGDVLYSINGKSVKTIVDVHEALKLKLPGQPVKLMMQSGGDLVARTVTLTEEKPVKNSEEQQSIEVAD